MGGGVEFYSEYTGGILWKGVRREGTQCILNSYASFKTLFQSSTCRPCRCKPEPLFLCPYALLCLHCDHKGLGLSVPLRLLLRGTGGYSVTHTHLLGSFGFTRALKQKIWPGIPSPESEFEGLFTTHKGNFQVGGVVVPSGPGVSLLLRLNRRSLSRPVLFPQLWLYQNEGCLWWSPCTPFAEDPPAPLEVLSERCWGATQAVEPGAEDEGRLLEPVGSERTQDTYLVLDKWLLPRSPPSEALPRPDGGLDTVAVDEGSEASSCSSALSLKPGPEGTLGTSFEYTILDPSSQLLRPRALPPELPPTPRHIKYLYLMVSDSGISTDYSSGGSQGAQGDSSNGPFSNPYENSLIPGAEPSPPSYVACS